MAYYETSPRPSGERDRERPLRPSGPAPPQRPAEQQPPKEPHALTLKVLRAARPTFGRNHDNGQDDIDLSLLAGDGDRANTSTRPSTSNFTLTPVLALPTSFGNINLGETFRGLVVAANDSGYEVFDPMLRVEMQTANTRVTLWDSSTAATGEPPQRTNTGDAQGLQATLRRSLGPGECLEAPMLEYEIKEPGLHALTCSVSYWSPPSQAPFLDPSKADERINRAFRKLYKFQASNPLSVKIKIHTPKSVAAAVDEKLQDTVYLEVQVQNVSPEPLMLQRLLFEPSQDHEVQDLTGSEDERPSLQPGDIMQCLYVLSITDGRRQDVIDRARQNDSTIGLGRLDIRWRGRMGETGHLATSQLGRRLPLALHQRSPFMGSAGLATLSSHVPPPPAVPSKSIHGEAGVETPQRYTGALSPMHTPKLGAQGFSPNPDHQRGSAASSLDLPAIPRFGNDLEAGLYVRSIESRPTNVGDIFTIGFCLKVTSYSSTRRRRNLKLAVQHVDYSQRYYLETQHGPMIDVGSTGSFDESTAQDDPRDELITPKADRIAQSSDRRKSTSAAAIATSSLPPPLPLPPSHPFYVMASTSDSVLPSNAIRMVGNSLVHLDTLSVDHAQSSGISGSSRGAKNASQGNTTDEATETHSSNSHASASKPKDDASESQHGGNALLRASVDSTATDDMALSDIMRKQTASRRRNVQVNFDLQYVALEPGILAVGGVRVLLLEDEWIYDQIPDKEAGGDGQSQSEMHRGQDPKSLCEYNVVAEVLVGG